MRFPCCFLRHGETVPFIIYLAKILHPDLFRDWDLKKEMQAFYSEVYGKTVTGSEAERILLDLPPLRLKLTPSRNDMEDGNAMQYM